MATILELSGASYPKVYNGEKITPLRGKSLLPVFENPNMEREGPLFWEWRDSQALRLNNWKIVRKDKNSQWDLYDMANDPTETYNLSKVRDEKVKELDQIYADWIKSHVRY
jgi:arylsulfatase